MWLSDGLVETKKARDEDSFASFPKLTKKKLFFQGLKDFSQ